MSGDDINFWPFGPKYSIVLAIIIFVVLLILFVVLKKTKIWPTINKSDVTVLIGILIFSLLPIILALVDVLIERGGVIKAGGVEIALSQASKMGVNDIKVPVNIGAPGQPISDSNTTNILDALKNATANSVVIIDLEDGQAWWETRLLVLLAGAVRLHKPEIIVFVGKDEGIEYFYQGWGYSKDLLSYLLQTNSQYQIFYHKAIAAAHQWEMVEPVGTGVVPPQPDWMQVGLATQHPWMAFDVATGLPNPLLAEQLLASDLGQNLETQAPLTISVFRLEELFRPVLHKESLDQTWSTKKQISEFFESDTEYIAITQNGKYKSLVSRLTVLNSILGTLLEKN
jgi:hypothetical protein